MYLFYLDNICLPITPSKLSTKIKGNNRTYELANSGEVNLIKFPGLTTYTFDFELIHDIEMIGYRASDVTPIEVLNFLEQAKLKKKVINFTVVRKMKNKTRFPLSQMVTVEDYTCEEDADNNSDFTVSIELKQFRPYRTKHMVNKAPRMEKLQQNRNTDKKTNKQVTPTQACLKKIVLKTDLNVRVGGGIKSKKLAVMKKGESPCVYGEKNVNGVTWYKIKHSAGDKDTSGTAWAWISGSPKYSTVLRDFKNHGATEYRDSK